jgi:hypothetical protein
MKTSFGKPIRLSREGIFLLSLPLITIAYQIIKPVKPFEIVSASFLLFLVAPFLVTRFILDENIYFLGFKKGKLLQGLLSVIIGWLIFFPILNLLADQAEFQKIYPPYPGMRESLTIFIIKELTIMLPAFIAVQTFIFGYAYDGVRKMIGKGKTMLILSFVAIPLFYLGKPAVEIILAMFAALVACWIRERSGSVLYPILFGWGLSVILDALLVYKLLI